MATDLAGNQPKVNRKPPWKGNNKRRLKFWTNFGLATAVFMGLGVAIAHGGNFTSALAWCGAALGAGALLGFLFGIPGRSGRRIIINQPGVAAIDTGINRATGTGGAVTTTPPAVVADGINAPVPDASPAKTPVPDANAANAPTPGAKGTNNALPGAPDAKDSRNPPATPGTDQPAEDSNLVQVSDWVTKLLLGGGLTQLQQIPGKVWELARWVAIGIDPTASVPGKEAILQSNQAFAAGLLMYFSILGFFSGYLITQLQFRKRLQP